MLGLGTIVLNRRLNKMKRLLQMKQNQLFHSSDSVELKSLIVDITEIEESIAQLEIAIDVIK